MDKQEIRKRYETASTVIRDAGAVALAYFERRGTLAVSSKGLQDFASEADLNTETFIHEQLGAVFPEDAFLGEETGATGNGGSGAIWVVDPIDGTQPFIRGMTSWCVSIALVVEGESAFGMVYAPARNELFAGGRNTPATLNGEPIVRTAEDELTAGIVGVGYSPKSDPKEFVLILSELLQRGGTFYRDGSGALALCYVATGGLVGYIETLIKSWDCLGALGVIHAVGLTTNDFLANGGLHRGNHLIVGGPRVYGILQEVYATLSASSR